MADERGKIKRPYNYILPGYAAPVFVTFLLPFYPLFEQTMEKMRRP